MAESLMDLIASDESRMKDLLEYKKSRDTQRKANVNEMVRDTYEV